MHHTQAYQGYTASVGPGPSGIVMVGKNAQDTEIQPDETRTMGMNHWRAGETFRGTEMTFKWVFAIWER